MGRKKYLIVMAAGSGTRMGAEMPKQFIELGGKAVLQMTIEKFMAACPDIKVVTVLPEAHIEYWRNYCLERNFICPQILVKGGITRFHSVRNALAKIPDGAVVAVHDGVRPFISKEKIISIGIFIFIGKDITFAEDNEVLFCSVEYEPEIRGKCYIATIKRSNYLDEIMQLQLENNENISIKEAIYHDFSEENDYTNLIKQYNYLQYNNMFDKNNKLVELFTVKKELN